MAEQVAPQVSLWAIVMLMVAAVVSCDYVKPTEFEELEQHVIDLKSQVDSLEQEAASSGTRLDSTITVGGALATRLDSADASLRSDLESLSAGLSSGRIESSSDLVDSLRQTPVSFYSNGLTLFTRFRFTAATMDTSFGFSRWVISASIELNFGNPTATDYAINIERIVFEDEDGLPVYEVSNASGALSGEFRLPSGVSQPADILTTLSVPQIAQANSIVAINPAIIWREVF